MRREEASMPSDDRTRQTHKMDNAYSFYRLTGRQIWVADKPIARKWIQLLYLEQALKVI